MDVNLSKLMSQGQPTAEDLHKELLQSAWKDYVRPLKLSNSDAEDSICNTQRTQPAAPPATQRTQPVVADTIFSVGVT